MYADPLAQTGPMSADPAVCQLTALVLGTVRLLRAVRGLRPDVYIPQDPLLRTELPSTDLSRFHWTVRQSEQTNQ